MAFEPVIHYTDAPDPADRVAIHRGIKQYNDAISPHHRQVRQTGLHPLDFYLRDGEGKLWGGLTADTYWGWMEIKDLWLHEQLRGQGWGRQLLARAEVEAQRRNCTRVHLRTFSFQARDFYQKYGYRVVGQLDDYPPGHTFYWMRKDLPAGE